jgi:hypothetical protein
LKATGRKLEAIGGKKIPLYQREKERDCEREELTAQLNKKLTMANLSIRQFDNCRIIELNATIKHKSFFKSQHFPDRLNYIDFFVLQHFPACLKNVAL